MVSQNERKRAVSSSILGIALLLQLCAVANSQVVHNGITMDPTSTEDGIATYDITQLDPGFIFIDGEGTVVNFNAAFEGDIFVGFFCSDVDSTGPTLNFGPAASASLLYVAPCSHINVYGGYLSFMLHVDPGAEVTIYGDKFEVDWTPQGPGTTLFGPGVTLVTAYDMLGFQLFTGYVYLAESTSSVLLDTETKSLELQVRIDVKPGADPCIINLRSNGVVPVAILSDPDTAFDATQVLPETVEFAGASVAVSNGGKYMAQAEDVDGDGFADMLLHFRTEDLQLDGGVAEAVVELTGQVGQVEGLAATQSASLVSDGTPISGTDNVYVLQSKKK